MPGSLILIDSETASSDSEIKLTGMTSTYDVYKAVLWNVKPATDEAYLIARFTVSGTSDDSANYSRASLEFKSGGVNGGSAQADQTGINMIQNGTATSETHQSTWYIFNASNSSEYTYCTFEEVSMMYDAATLRGRHGGATLKEDQATDGISFHYSSGNIASGEFRLYGLKK